MSKALKLHCLHNSTVTELFVIHSPLLVYVCAVKEMQVSPGVVLCAVE